MSNRHERGADTAKDNGNSAAAGESLVDYSKVTKKSLLVERVLQLQNSIQDKKEQLEKEAAL